MAKLSFVLKDIDGKEHIATNILSYNLSMDWDAACHGLMLEYISDDAQNEICSLQVFNNGTRIFNGYIDTQREAFDINGNRCFLYARSSACLLTDNEATPFTYISPNSISLFNVNALPLGFSCSLPNLYSNQEYLVSKGVSCFGAINDFVQGISGKRIYVDADDCISLLQGSRSIALDSNDVISEKRIINRGDAIARLDYKTDSANGFDHHLKSRYLEEKGIKSSKKYNLSSLPIWQRDSSLHSALASAVRNYYKLELMLDGAVDWSLGDEVTYNSRYFGIIDNLQVMSICYTLDSKGERSTVTLSKNIDLKELNYVD